MPGPHYVVPFSKCRNKRFQEIKKIINQINNSEHLGTQISFVEVRWLQTALCTRRPVPHCLRYRGYCNWPIMWKRLRQETIPELHLFIFVAMASSWASREKPIYQPDAQGSTHAPDCFSETGGSVQMLASGAFLPVFEWEFLHVSTAAGKKFICITICVVNCAGASVLWTLRSRRLCASVCSAVKVWKRVPETSSRVYSLWRSVIACLRALQVFISASENIGSACHTAISLASLRHFKLQ